ncbi:hypothetical protein BX666DRAFT_1520052 [Dichotomocladium elegans]|nr:hypothetical protein BX666DRAFT_1520052 [Dichotomocladium elegans]
MNVLNHSKNKPKHETPFVLLSNLSSFSCLLSFLQVAHVPHVFSRSTVIVLFLSSFCSIITRFMGFSFSRAVCIRHAQGATHIFHKTRELDGGKKHMSAEHWTSLEKGPCFQTRISKHYICCPVLDMCTS